MVLCGPTCLYVCAHNPSAVGNQEKEKTHKLVEARKWLALWLTFFKDRLCLLLIKSLTQLLALHQ